MLDVMMKTKEKEQIVIRAFFGWRIWRYHLKST